MYLELKKQNYNEKKELVDLVKNLISYQSTADKPDEINNCLKLIEDKFGYFFYVKRYKFKGRPMLVLSTSTSKNLDIIISGHVDVVPAKESAFLSKEINGKIYGRGAIDMKSAIVACLFAVQKYIKEKGRAKLAIVITSDEELDGLSTKWLLEKKKYQAKLAILPDGGDETKLILKQKGFWQIRIMIKGKSVHASTPWNGSNPFEKGFNLYKKLLSKFPLPTNDGQWKTSISLTKIEGGKAINQIPDLAIFYFDIRYTDEIVKRKIAKELISFLGKEAIIEIISHNGVFVADKNNPFIIKLKKAIQKELRKKVCFISECGTSDAVFFSEQGIPAILFRPQGHGAHRDGEWVDIKSLIHFKSVIFNFLKEI